MIPKTIHYCWFSNEKKTRQLIKCIDSWSRVMPDYFIKCWDKDSFDFESVTFVKEAFAAKKFAFVADYVRLFALYTEGGIYLDSDVLVKRKFDPFISESFFCGTEAFYIDQTVHYRMETAVMGAEKAHPFLLDCLAHYQACHFDMNRSESDCVMPAVISKLAEKKGYAYENKLQRFSGITVFPTEIFCNKLIHHEKLITSNAFAIHQNAGSWIDYSDRGWLFKFCKKNHLMGVYHKMEKLFNLFG